MTRAFVIALALLAVPAVAAGQDRESARADFRAAVEALEADDLANAELLFRRSIAKYPTTAARCNLALTLDRAGRIEEAIGAYRECAALDSSSSGHYGSHATERAAELEQELAARREAHRTTTTTTTTTPTTTAPPADPQPVIGPAQSSAPAPAQPVMTYRQEPPEDSPSRAFLWLGLTSTILGAVAIVTAAALASAANEDADVLATAGYPMMDGRYLIPADDPGADVLAKAESKSTASLGFYVAGGILGAVGVTFFIVQAATSSGSADDQGTSVAFVPLEDGAAVSVHGSF